MAEAGGWPEPDIGLAERLFDALAARTRRGRGIVRDSYGPGEQAGHDIAQAAAEDLGLEIALDAAANLYMTLPGRDRAAPAFVIGSHLDSVPQGGNFDGAAGVVAGLAALAGFRQAGLAPAFDLTVMAIRAEEAAWFDFGYVGAHAAFGLLPPAVLDGVRRSDSGRTLAEHMAECACDVAAIRRGEPYLTRSCLRGYLEVHIEQGPVLEGGGVALGLVTGIRGCLRFRRARCLGAYGHSGALPRTLRRDAVAATAALVHRLHEDWVRLEGEGQDLTFTVGEFTTDPLHHGPTKVAGETRFVLDFRSLSDRTMDAMRARAKELAAELETRYGVRFDLGEPSYCAPARLDQGVRARLARASRELGIPALEMASGAGHDAVVFANLGVPAGMIFIRNANGSHNPDEAMDIADFRLAARLLGLYLATEAEARPAAS
ncbi:MAG: hydantoinase/carbamoylase family amidase [Pseudomonadota bacterium]